MAGLFILYADSSTSVNIDPEYDFKDTGNKIEDVHETKQGNEYRYKWGERDRVSFTLMHINSADMCRINSWYSANTNLTFKEIGVTASEKSVRISNKSKPIDSRVKPYYDQFKGTLVLETYM